MRTIAWTQGESEIVRARIRELVYSGESSQADGRVDLRYLVAYWIILLRTLTE